VQASTGTVRHYGASTLVDITRCLAGQVRAPVALHFDHGTDRKLISECIRAGFSSVMVDASRYSFNENVRLTRDVVEEAHRHGVDVEGEIGMISGVEDDLVIAEDDAIYTKPAVALEFQLLSGVDFLAVAIGTAHGLYKKTPRLDIAALQAIRADADFPLVVHGGTGLTQEVVRSLVSSGCSKMNVSTQIKITFIDSLYEYMSDHRDEYEPMRVLDYARSRLSDMVQKYMELLGSADRAPSLEIAS
jgi:ketose-bisphosphate aldolase